MASYPKTPSPQFLLLSTMVNGTEYPFCQLGSAVWCAPSQLLAHPQPTDYRGRVGEGESLEAVQALLSSSQNTGVLSTLFYSQIQNHSTVLAAMKKMNSIPARPSTPDHPHSNTALLALTLYDSTYL